MFKFEMKGFKELKGKLQDLERKVGDLMGRQSVPLSELLTPDFLAKYTNFASPEEMFQASGFKVESQEDFEKIPDDEWDKFIKSRTRFSSWEEMLSSAAEKWAARKLGL